MANTTGTDFNDPEYYTNRELSWLQFNMRILLEARDKNNPLFERLKFLSITSSNLDEFFMVRVASLKDMVEAKCTKPDLAGMKPSAQLKAVMAETHEFVALQSSTFNRSLMPALEKEGLTILTSHQQMNEEQCRYADTFFDEDVYPVLTPMAVDPARPFPLIRNKSLNLCVLVKSEENEEEQFATVQVPSVLSRIIELPSDGKRTVILLEKIIERNLFKLFENHSVLCAHPYRITRNADLYIDEDDASDLLKEIQKQLKQRQRGEAIRLEIEERSDKRILKFLKKQLNVEQEQVYDIQGPVDLTFLMKLYGMEGFEHLKQEKYIPRPSIMIREETDIFTQIRSNDILLHHPYESFEPVIRFVAEAAADENVLAIKQTLYRVSGHSPIVAALEKAAENGKQVTVLVELKARFDEENNIQWAKKLEKAGCHVIYGLMGLKTHSKITLVVRKEEDGIRRYVHLGTGNYNDATAKLYTDMGLLTCNESIGEDATAAFNMISGYSEPKQWNKLSLAPHWLRDRFMRLIKREIKQVKEGNEGLIIAKMNSLCDSGIIAALYEASAAGVKIHLIVRGICCLKTGIPGISENITVRSLVGTFLEHSRIFYFRNGGNEEVYMASADWMPRNLDKRVEIMFPVEDESLKREVLQVLDIQLRDTMKAHILKGSVYEKVDRRGKEHLEAQKYFCTLAASRADTKNEGEQRTFIPMKG